MKRLILPLFLMLTLSFANEEISTTESVRDNKVDTTSLPYSITADKHTEKLECVFKKYLIQEHPYDALIKLDITSSDSIVKLFENQSLELDIYKAFVLDYYYKSANAEKFYKNAAERSKKNLPYYISFLARSYSYKYAIKELGKIGVFTDTNKIDRLCAMIYMAHDKKIEHSLMSRLKRNNINIDEIERIFYGCN